MKPSATDKKEHYLLIAGIILISFILRPAITSVGPLIPFISEEMELTNTMAGFLTTLPLLTFATFSLFSTAIGNKSGLARAILYGMIILAAGMIIRVTGGKLLLYCGTALVGIGIVICNVLIIPLVKLKLPDKVGIMTSLYTTGMSFFAAIASGTSVPLAEFFDSEWRGALLFWVFPLVATIFIWIPQIKSDKLYSSKMSSTPSVNVWRKKLAWNVSLFMGIQSFLFFSLVAWLPTIIQTKGFDPEQSGWVLSIMMFASLPGSFIAPVIASRMKNQIPIIYVITICYLIGFLSLYSNEAGIIYSGVTVLGLGMGASISLAYAMISLRTRENRTTTSLSAMSQSSGYYIAAMGPFLIGALTDYFNDWNTALHFFLFSIVLFLYWGIASARDLKI